MSKPDTNRKILRAIGLMSGTSMDGIDAALLETDGEAVVRRLGFISVPYDDAFRARLRDALVVGAPLTDRYKRPNGLAQTEAELTARHALLVQALLDYTGFKAADVDVIGFHGQTVLHRPEDRLTVQIGDGAALAHLTGIDVIYDLRADDVAAGGEGAPLAPVYHHALAQTVAPGPAAFLNIGGVANVTFIDARGQLLAFDTGPGSALIDDWVQARDGGPFDDGGQLALTGRVDSTILAGLMSTSYFDVPPPKSLDRNAFDAGALKTLSLADGAATLTSFTVEAIAAATAFAADTPEHWIVSGGGRRNAAMMAALRKSIEGRVSSAEEVGLDGDAIEAEAWAYLAVRSLRGLVITYPGTTGVQNAMTGGVLARAGRPPPAS